METVRDVKLNRLILNELILPLREKNDINII